MQIKAFRSRRFPSTQKKPNRNPTLFAHILLSITIRWYSSTRSLSIRGTIVRLFFGKCILFWHHNHIINRLHVKCQNQKKISRNRRKMSAMTFSVWPLMQCRRRTSRIKKRPVGMAHRAAPFTAMRPKPCPSKPETVLSTPSKRGLSSMSCFVITIAEYLW